VTERSEVQNYVERSEPPEVLPSEPRRAWLAALEADRSLQALVILVAVGGLLRFGWSWWATRTPVGFNDPSLYLQYGESIARGHGYIQFNGEPTAYYPIGYPATLGALFFVVLHTVIPDNLPLAATMLNVALGTAQVALMGALGRRLVSPWAGVAVAGIVAFYPHLVFHTGAILTETLFNTVLAAALVLLVRRPFDAPIPWWRLGLVGVLFGYAGLVRPVGLVAVVALGLVWWWRRQRVYRPLRQFGIVVGGCVLVVSPWVIRNAVVMGEATLATNTGDNLCIGNNPVATGAFQLPDECFGDFQTIGDRHVEARRDRVLTRRGLDWMVHHPLQEPKLIFWRTYWTYVSDYDGLRAVQSYENNQWMNPELATVLSTTADAYYFGVLTLGGLGLVLFVRRGDARLLFVLVAIAALAITVWPFFGDARFHLPVSFLMSLPAGAALIAALARP
jgi:4-amino-4-deoxy-L-arabinose transferase-like glycosyltransferase